TLLPYPGYEGKAVRRAHLCDGVAIDAVAGRFDGRGRLLQRPGIYAPRRLLRRCDAELGLERFDTCRVCESMAGAAMLRAAAHPVAHASAHLTRHSVTHTHAHAHA